MEKPSFTAPAFIKESKSAESNMRNDNHISKMIRCSNELLQLNGFFPNTNVGRNTNPHKPLHRDNNSASRFNCLNDFTVDFSNEFIFHTQCAPECLSYATVFYELKGKQLVTLVDL